MSNPDKKVILAAPYSDADGRNHKPDSAVTLDRAEANRLLAAGLARLPETSATADEKKEG